MEQTTTAPLRERALLLFRRAELEVIQTCEYSLTLSYLFDSGAFCLDRAPLGPLSSRFMPGMAPTDACLKAMAGAVIKRLKPLATLTVCQNIHSTHLSLVGALDSLSERILFERRLQVHGSRLRLADFTEFPEGTWDVEQKRSVGLHLFDAERLGYAQLEQKQGQKAYYV